MDSTGKKYSIVYADPPWEFKVWGSRRKGKSAENHYATQTLEWLHELSIRDICAEDSVLFMWATFPHLRSAMMLGHAWGFEYKTVAFVWVKKNKHNGHFFTGTGYYTRANAEPVLLFTRGKPLSRAAKDVGQIIYSQVGQHSMKPPEVRSRIVRLFGDLPRVELFARSRKGFFPDYEYKGWDVFGNEANNSIELPGER
jgi:N6-adenosine-specific RNA methylase IME4